MTLIVEDGTGLPDSESYVSVVDFRAYAVGVGPALDATDEGCEQALRRATAWIDASFCNRFSGRRAHGREQALEWPRSNAADIAGNQIAANAIPREMTRATCEAALREVSGPGALSPDLERGGRISSVQAGSVGVTFAAGAPVETIFATIDNALASLIGRRQSGISSGSLVRG